MRNIGVIVLSQRLRRAKDFTMAEAGSTIRTKAELGWSGIVAGTAAERQIKKLRLF